MWNATQTVVTAAALILDAFSPGGSIYTPWVDNHDGYHYGPFDGGSVMNISAALDGDVPMEIYGVDSLPNEMRTYVPGTLWTVDIHLHNLSSETSRQLDTLDLVPDPDYCRESVLSPPIRPGWWKATYMAARPEVAAQFMVDIFGAQHIESPYPWPPRQNCTAAKWVDLPQLQFELHFVLSLEWQPANFSIQEQVQEMSGYRALESGIFHVSMYNSLVLFVDSLDLYILRLKARSLPYMLMVVDSQQYALFMIIPENAITVQLRSQHLSVQATISEALCSEDFGQMAL